MSARAIWIVSLGGALTVFAALNFWQSQPSGSDGVKPRPSPTGERARSSGDFAAPQAEDASPLPNGAADVGVAPRADAPTEPNAATQVNQPAATPMGDILAARGMPVTPELLETERTFAAEPRDPDWSTAAEAQILARFAEIPGLELASLNVECRRTLCRLQSVAPRIVPEGPPSAEQLARLRAGPQIPGIAELVRETGLKGRFVWGLNPVSMAYLERGEPADTPAATR